MQKAIFLDRDGTINEEVDYLTKAEELKLIPNTSQALRKLKDLGFLNIIVTNQSGIARGYLNEEELSTIHDELLGMLHAGESEAQDKLIDDIFYSPFHEDGVIDKYSIASEDRKPNTGMIRKATLKHNIDLKESFFVGDSFTDMMCAQNSGLKKILVMTGVGEKDLEKCKSENLQIDYYARDLDDASQYIQNLQTNLKA